MSAVVTVRTQRRPRVDAARDYISLTKPRVIVPLDSNRRVYPTRNGLKGL